ncbi:MAG: T9SS type A sorting domain-containing protein [Saprospiraceae bacterium]|nr:T9SS type A sorting domain-containing protein [Saprospiraceae bacterium]
MVCLLAQTGYLFAQTSCPWLSDFRIEMIAVMPGGIPGSPNCPSPDCDEITYEVYLKTDNPIYTTFEYSWLSVTGIVKTNGVSSYIEENPATENCFPAYSAAEFSIENDPAGYGVVTFSLGDPFGTASPATSGQTISLTNGSALLFTVTVHAAPGSVIRWENPFYDTASPPAGSGGNPYLSAYYTHNQFLNCQGAMQVGFGPAASPNATMPSPAACPAGMGYFIDVPQQLQVIPVPPGQSVNIPIILSGLPTGVTIDEIEAVIEITYSTSVNFGAIGSDVFPCPNGFKDPGCGIKLLDYTIGTVRYREVVGFVKGISLNATQTQLFNIELEGLENSSSSGCIHITVKSVRVKIDGECCLLAFDPSLGGFADAQVCFTGVDVCDEYYFSITELQGGNDCEIGFRLNLTWFDPAVPSILFERMRLRILFRTSAPLSPAILSNTLCANNCVTINTAGTNLYEVSIDAMNITVAYGSGLDIVFSGQSGCVLGFYYAESFVETDIYPDPCLPQLFPSSSSLGYSLCFARLGGEIELKLTQDCASNYIINATPAQGAPQNCAYTKVFDDTEPKTWSYCACANGFPYTVQCSKFINGAYLNNVSSYDNVLLSMHLLSIKNLGSTFKEVAADVNCDGALSREDLGEIRNLILGITLSFPFSPSYKIIGDIPPSQNINYGLGMSPYCTSSLTKTIGTPSDEVDFYAVKTGDVSWNDDVHPVACFSSTEVSVRAKSTLPVIFENAPVKAGELVRIPIYLSQSSVMVAWQLGVQFDPSRMMFKGLHQGNDFPGEVFFGDTQADFGEVRMLWFDERGNPVSAQEGHTLCYLEFLALHDLHPNELSIKTDIPDFESLAFDESGRETLMVSAQSIAGKALDMHIYPNPSGEVTYLNYTLPFAGPVLVSIHDVHGQLISATTQSASHGRQTVLLTGKDFGSGFGLFTVTVRSEGMVETQKVLRLK